MQEILPGLYHWTAFHEGIRQQVSSYYVEASGTLIDAMEPDAGLDWFAGRRAPERVVLTNRHHYRHADRFAAAFGTVVRCSEPGMHEFEGTARDVRPFAFGEHLARGIVALEVGAICPDEAALHIDVEDGALAFADGVVRAEGGALAFVPDFLLGDDPEAVKAGLREAFGRLLSLDFDHLLLAHGEPVVGGGKAALRRFVEG
jgi:hypothetical protein